MRESSRITRKSASNLALAFVMLPREKREAMSALYAFCREVDDAADEDALPVEVRQKRLAHWREDIRRACGTSTPEIVVNRELQPVIHRHSLPCSLFEALLDGVEMDLAKKRYANWDELEVYCYKVASVVGLLSIRIFGHSGPAHEEYAISLGKALQITNILRDVRTDAKRERIYIPQSDLQRYGVAERDILDGRWSEAYAQMAASIADRAEAHYAKARATLPAANFSDMIASELMGAVYWKLLLKLRQARFNVFGDQAVRLSKPSKVALVLRSWAAFRLFGAMPRYGSTRR